MSTGCLSRVKPNDLRSIACPPLFSARCEACSGTASSLCCVCRAGFPFLVPPKGQGISALSSTSPKNFILIGASASVKAPMGKSSRRSFLAPYRFIASARKTPPLAKIPVSGGVPIFSCVSRQHRSRPLLRSQRVLHTSRPSSTSSTSVLPAARSPLRIRLAISVSAALCRYRFSGRAP